MEENVALDSTKQKKFVKSIRGIKKLIKKNEKKKVKSDIKENNEQPKPEKAFSMRLKAGYIRKKRRIHRGLVYLSHIPHGFYEHQMTQYFKQFGVVTNARVIKSKRTGNSKGYAFVEFKEPSVAQIVAETMNNYLMGKRLIKAVYIPPEKIRSRAFRKKWNSVHNPTSLKRRKLNKAFNAEKSEDEDLKKARRLLTNLNKTKKKLSAMGINYDFFTPVDVPMVLLDRVIKKENEEGVKEEIESKPKKGKKQNIEQKDTRATNKVKDITEKNNSKTGMIAKASAPIEVNKKKKQDKKEIISKNEKKDNKPVKVNEKEQQAKEKKLKEAGVKSMEDFISIDAEDSDGSCEFDSDEFEKMLEEDDDDSEESHDESGDELESGEEESSQEDGDYESNEDDEEEAPVAKESIQKFTPKVVQPVQTKKHITPQMSKKHHNQVINDKKKTHPKSPVPAKKLKFAKQNLKLSQKQFKKK